MVKSYLAGALSDTDAAPADADIELLLPWHATGALGAADAQRVSAALACNAQLANHIATIRREQTAVAEMAEQLGAPSLRPMLALFAAIDAGVAIPA